VIAGAKAPLTFFVLYAALKRPFSTVDDADVVGGEFCLVDAGSGFLCGFAGSE
jgi:hypothetical protein